MYVNLPKKFIPQKTNDPFESKSSWPSTQNTFMADRQSDYLSTQKRIPVERTSDEYFL